jgi:subtilisin-like proprotein convertase family protein
MIGIPTHKEVAMRSSRAWSLLVASLALAGSTGAQTLSRDPHPRPVSSRPAPQGGTCGPTEITESASQNIVGGNSIACADATTGFTFENHYWRAFDLPSFSIGGIFEVCQVEIAVEAAISIAGDQPLTVNLYWTGSGGFPGGTLTSIGTANLTVPDQDQSFLTVPITATAPAGSTLVVEVASPDGTTEGYAFYIGSNDQPQTAPSYLSADACGVTTPTDLADLNFPNMHIVINVRGAELPGVIPPPPPECTDSTTIFSNNTPVAIPDLTTVTSTIAVSGKGPYLWDLNLTTAITHTSSSDLVITLTSPTATIVTISSNNGGSNADVFNGTLWDDDAGDSNPPGPVTLATFSNGVTETPLVPEGAMGAFIGEDPNGTWTLTITDAAAGNTGTLNDWSLEITSLAAAPHSSETVAGEQNPVPIPDDGTAVVSSVVFPSVFSSICGARAITNIQHPSSGDLVVTLTSPAGTVVTLTSRNGGSNADIFNGTEWTDHALTPVTDYVFSDGVLAAALAPEEAMGAFIGENPTGNWTLSVTDQFPGGAGSLNAWRVTLKSCTCNTAEANAPLRIDEHSGPGVSSNLNGVFEAGENVQVETSWMNPGTTPFALEGFAQNFTGPGGPAYTISNDFADYGVILPSATSNCYDATGSCFGLQITGPRPLQHWDATFDETVSLSATPSGDLAPPLKTWALHIGESFPDVATSNQFYKFIETIFHKGVTGGCNATDYCPLNPALRKQMAVFVLKAKEGSSYLPPAATGIFADMPPTDPFAPWIEELYNRGVVGGCTAPPNPNYCPENPVLRQQMSVFLLKTLLGSSYVPPSCTGIFADVLCPSLFADWIEDLFNRGIAAGCGGGNYCPANANTRGQMAVFLTKTFGLLLYGP